MEVIWPMGCKKTDPVKAKSLMKNDLYVGQEKLDGVRALLHVTSTGSFRFTTRGSTLDDPGTPIDITHRLPHLAKYKIPSMAGTVIDGELLDLGRTSAEVAGIVSYKSMVPVPRSIHFYVFDVIRYKGSDLELYTLRHRLNYLQALSSLPERIPSIHIVPVLYTTREKSALLDKVFAEGKEGIVLKNLISLYFQGKKKAGTWYKVKRKDTLDAVITGSKPPEQYYKNTSTGAVDLSRITKPWGEGWLGSIEFAFEDDNGVTHSGYCSGLTDADRAMFSDGKHGIKEQYIGRVIEVEYMEKTKDGNLRHPRFKRLRPEIEK